MDTIDRVRAFNRFYTRWLGLLQRSYLDSGLSLAEVRVVYELGAGQARTARALSQGLAMDEGHLSRLLGRLRTRGLVARHPDPADARQAILSLTDGGLRVYDRLAERSRDDIGRALEHLPPAGQAALCAAAETVQSLLSEAPAEAALRDLRPGDAGWIIGQHGMLYARDEGYDQSFEALVAEILAAFLRDHDPAFERGWIAEQAGRRLGSIFCVRQDAETAKLRLFLLLPEARGTGLAPRMLATCMDWARARGYRRMVLWTHESHHAACALYRKAGWRMTAQSPSHSFGQDTIDQTWEIDL